MGHEVVAGRRESCGPRLEEAMWLEARGSGIGPESREGCRESVRG
jgi:hypothetical protein